jgi:hypothetical protein
MLTVHREIATLWLRADGALHEAELKEARHGALEVEAINVHILDARRCSELR